MKYFCFALTLCLSLIFAAAAGADQAEVGKTYGINAEIDVIPGGFVNMGTGCITVEGVANTSTVVPVWHGCKQNGECEDVHEDAVHLDKGKRVSGDFTIEAHLLVSRGKVKVIRYDTTGGGCPNHFHLRH